MHYTDRCRSTGRLCGAHLRSRCGGSRAYGRPMRTELPAERLQRRLGADLDAEANDSDPDDDTQDDPNSLLPRWLPDAAAGKGWAARLRADPGRTGAIALAVIAALAVLITIFTLVRDRPAPVTSAKLPPVERV